jgi:hypothetical protein
MSVQHWDDMCSLCNRSRFWPSRSGYFVCAICTPDPLAALAILARRSGVAAVARAQTWAESASGFNEPSHKCASSIENASGRS